MGKTILPHKFVQLILTAALVWGNPLQSKVPHDILAQMAQVSYKLHHAPRVLRSWNMVPLEDERHTYGALFYPRAPGGKEAVIALKGTENAEDWLRNSMYESTLCRGCGTEENLQVHKGYYIRAKEILSPLNTALTSSGLNGYRLHFTGHSLGGAVVSILSLLNIAGGSKSSYQSLVTFGAPQAGNEATVLRLNTLFGARQAHYRFWTDMVPLALPLLQGIPYLWGHGEDPLTPMHVDYSYPLLLDSPPGSDSSMEVTDSDDVFGALRLLVSDVRHSMRDYQKALEILKNNSR